MLPPKRFAMTNSGRSNLALSYAKEPQDFVLPLFCGEDEIRTRGSDCSLRRFSKPVVSATHPPLRALF